MLACLRASLYEPAGLTEISPYTSKSFVKYLMCPDERAGWLGSRDLVFSNRDLCNQAENFAM